jgi:pilus assembly protein Flp/PilA
MQVNLKRLNPNAIWLLTQDTQGQDFVEYALLAGFMAVSVGAIMPNLINNISTIFSKVGSVLIWAGTSGS